MGAADVANGRLGEKVSTDGRKYMSQGSSPQRRPLRIERDLRRGWAGCCCCCCRP
jgi:hypothetical protein